jgi:chromosome segregation ATPase
MSVGISFGSLTLGAKTYISSKANAILSEIQDAFTKDSQSTSASQTGQSSLKSGTTTTTPETTKPVNRDYLLEISDYIVKLEANYEASLAKTKTTIKTLSSDREATVAKIKDKHDQKEKAEKHTKELLLSLALIKAPKLRGSSMEELNEFTKQKREYNKKYSKCLTKIVPLKIINDKVTKDIEKFEAELSAIDKKILAEYETEKQAKAEKEQAEADAIAVANAIAKAKAQTEAQAKAQAQEDALALAMSIPAATTPPTTTNTGSNLTISA